MNVQTQSRVEDTIVVANPEPYNRIYTVLPSGKPIWIEVPGRLTAEDKAWLLRLIDLFLVEGAK